MLIIMFIFILLIGIAISYKKSIVWRIKGAPEYIRRYEVSNLKYHQRGFHVQSTYMADEEDISSGQIRISGPLIKDETYENQPMLLGEIEEGLSDYRWWLVECCYVRKDLAETRSGLFIRHYRMPKNIDLSQFHDVYPFPLEVWAIYLGKNDRFNPSFSFEIIAKYIGMDYFEMWKILRETYGVHRISVFPGLVFCSQEQAESALDWLESYRLVNFLKQ